jgi:chromosome segregation ATPase
MKKALSTVLVGALSLFLFLATGYAQGEVTVPELLDQELAALDAVFGDLQSFMGELVVEVKGNMGDIDEINYRIDDLKDVVQAISIELKTAEGKIIGLRNDVDGMARIQQETQIRLVVLETGLSELSAAFAECCARLEAEIFDTQANLATLTDQVAALIVDYNNFKDEYAAFKEGLAADLLLLQGEIDALDERVLAIEAEEIGAFKEATIADISMLQKGQDALAARVQILEDQDVGTFKKKVLQLERSMSALSIKIDNNRAKLEGFDQAIASLASEIETNRGGLLANMNLLEDHEIRISGLEGGTQLAALEEQVNTLYFISIVALLAGIGALVWGFLQ